MTATNDPADVIEQAAKVMSLRHHGRESSACNMRSHEKDARALHDAHLLADTAGRDEPDWQAIADQAEQDMAHWVRECGDAERRAERAEAELSNMEADYERRGERLWRLAAKAGHEPSESDNDASAELTIETTLTELRATIDRVREFLSEPVAVLSDGAVRDNYRMARAALDGAGEQP